MIKATVIDYLYRYGVFAISEIGNLYDGYLPDTRRALRGYRSPDTVIICIAIISINDQALYKPSAAVRDLNDHKSACGVGLGNNIKAGSLEGKVCGRRVTAICICINRYLMIAVHAEGKLIIVYRIITVEVIRVKLRIAVIAGTVLSLFGILIVIRNSPFFRVINKAVLVIDGGCRNYGEVSVIVGINSCACQVNIRTPNSICKRLNTIHKHWLTILRSFIELIANSAPCIVCDNCFSISALLFRAKSTGKCNTSGAAKEGTLCLGPFVLRCNACNCLIVNHAEKIILQHVDRNGQTIVNNYSIVSCSNSINHSEPNGSVAAICTCSGRAIAEVRSAIAGNICGCGFIGTFGNAPTAIGHTGSRGYAIGRSSVV